MADLFFAHFNDSIEFWTLEAITISLSVHYFVTKKDPVTGIAFFAQL